MKRVAILDDYQNVALTSADWSGLDGRVDVAVFNQHITDVEELIATLVDFEIIVAMRERTAFPREVVERLEALELLVTTGSRNAAIDADALAELGITYCGTGGQVQSTAELTWALILACARHLPTEVANVANGGWMTTVGTDLYGATLGLCGLGRIGAMVARVGAAFGMDLIAWSQNLTEERCAEHGARLVTKDELFTQSDFVTVHLVLSDRTTGIIAEPELRAMKQTAWLINTSRGPICDESILATACQEGWIAGAGLDAYGSEPLAADHPFRSLSNVLATPHIGYVSQRVYAIFFNDIVEDITCFLDGSPVRVL
ncbi:MAG: D-2-hydroxyacid dehydrogenase family protein [Acidimicrobiales bacterium]